MDPSNSNLVSDGGSLRQIHINEVSVVSTSSTSSKKSSGEGGKERGIRKHIIRKITPLDLQKLQHTGLDRKIAEALNKHKSEQKSKLANFVPNDTKTSTYQDLPITSTKPNDLPVLKTTNIQDIKLAKNPVITYKNKRNPPKIAVTVPDPLPDIEIEKISTLEPQQRLVHVKNLLNKKILQKTSTQTNDETKTNQLLKPAPPPALYESPQRKLMKNVPQEKALTATKGYTILKEPVEVLASTKSSSKLKSEVASKPKSPKDIARKLDFEAKDETETPPQKYFKCLKDPNELKKYAIKSAKSQQLNVTLDSNSTQSIKKVQQKQNFQSEYLKQQSVTYCSGIPKASIKTSPSKEPNSCLPHVSKQQKRNELKMDVPQGSAIPKERPSPLVDSPKKLHYLRNSCDQINPDYSSFGQESTTLPVQLNLPQDFEATSKVSNCLIVLENKVLSQEEMIDLTELRLSKSTSGFANSHRPIPEVLIKQEQIDEYPETNSFAQIEKNEPVPSVKKNLNKKNTRIIINTEKLKLPPEKLAALAKKLKQQTSAAFTLPKKINDDNKFENVRVLSTPPAERKHPSNALQHNMAGISQTAKAGADNAVAENHQICSDEHKKNYSYQVNHTERNLKAVADPNIVQNSIVDQLNVMDKTSITKNNQSYMDKKLKKKDKCETKISCSTDNAQQARRETTDIENYKNDGNFHNKSFVEIVDEPLAVDDGFSAVDFILALSKTNHVTEQVTLGLSPEELDLNASCSKNFSPVRLQSVGKALSPRSTSNKIEDLKNDSDTISCKSHAAHFESSDTETSKSVYRTTIKPNSGNISTFKVAIEKWGKYKKGHEILIPTNASPTKFSSTMDEIQNKLDISLGEVNESYNKDPELVIDSERPTNKNLTNITASNHTTQSNLNTVTLNQNLNEVLENSLAALNSKKGDLLKNVRTEEEKGASESIEILQFESKPECELNIKVNEQKSDDISTSTAGIEKLNRDKKGNEILIPSDTTTTNISSTTYEIQNKYDKSVGKVNESCNKDVQLVLDLKEPTDKYLTNITGPNNSTPNIAHSCTVTSNENLTDVLINTLAASNSKKGDILNYVTSGTDSDCHEEKGYRSKKKSELKKMRGEKSQITEENTEKNLDIFSTETGYQANIEKSTPDSDWRDSREFGDVQSKDKQGLTKESQVDDGQRGEKQDFTKSIDNAEGGVITLDIELSKTESRCFSKTVINRNNDKKENRDIPFAEISNENIENENSGEKYTDLVIKTTSGANTKLLPKDITEISSKNSKPPKRKRGRAKKNPETETSKEINLQKTITSDSSEDDGQITSEISLGEVNESCNKDHELVIDSERQTNKNLTNITASNHTTQSNLNTVTPNQNLNEVLENSLAALNSKKGDLLKNVRTEEKKGASESIEILQFESKPECESDIKVNEQKSDDISTSTAGIEKLNRDKKGNEILIPSDTTTTNISSTTYEIQNKYDKSVGKVNESCNKDVQLVLDLKEPTDKYLTNITGPNNSTPNIPHSCTVTSNENLTDVLINTLAASNSKKGDILNYVTSGTDSDCHEEKGYRSKKKSELKKMRGEKSQITEENTEKNLDIFSTETVCQANIEKSTPDSDWRDSREFGDVQSKDKQGLTKESQVDDGQRGEKQDFTKSINNAEGGVITLDIELSKTESRCFSKTVKNRNNDKKENRDIPFAEISNENIENENSGEKYTDLVIKTTSSANTKILPKDITEISSKNSKPPKRKRGRAKKNPETETPTQINLQKSIISDSSEDDGPSTSAKKAGPKVQRKKRKGEMEEYNSDSSAKKPGPKVQRKKRKGEMEEYDSDSLLTPLIKTPSNKSLKFTATRTQRKRLCNESNFNPRLLLIRNRAQLDTDEILTETAFESGAVQCGLCLKHTQPEKWSLHLSEHYGVGWKVGEEELEIEYRSVVMSNMLKYLKNNSSSVLTCRMCQRTYRSALGILNHIELCGAEIVRVECEFCHKDYAASSLPVHMRTCFARSNIDNQSTEENLCENNKKKEVFGKSGRLKRHSTIKAENKLKVLGAELEQINDNIKKANFDPKSHIKYMTATEDNFSAKWSKDIKELGHAICPQFSCKFTSSDEKELASHLKKCKYVKSGYGCNFCWRLFPSEKTAIEHVLKSHQKGRRKSNDSDCDLNIDDEVSSDDNNISEGVDENELTDFPSEDDDGVENVNDNRKDSKKQPHKRSFNRSKTSNQTSLKELYGARSRDLDKKVLQKWMNFLKTNYSCKPLFAEFTSQYLTLLGQDFKKYLPSETISMKFNFDSNASLITTPGVPEKGIKWSQLKRFESIKERMNTYYFLGAPIQVCSWLPLPDHVNEQYLAIVYRQNIFKYTKFTNPKQHHSIIIIFKVTQSNVDPDISIHYGLVVNDGPIHNLSFLPSGGYDESSNRLGLVAVGTINSCIKIYSLPLKLELFSMQDKEIIPLIDVKPSFILVLDILCKETEMEQNTLLRTQCLQICWSEYTNHQHIFAGFSNGFIGIWNIVNDPQGNLNRFEGNDIINYVPVNYFYSGEKMVKGMALHYDTTGPRWLAVSTVYRKFIIYDIKNFMRPIILKEEIQKNIPLALDWCPIWETVLLSYCDTLQNNGRCVLVISPNNILFTQYKLEIACCGITQIHYTPRTNILVTGSNNGDIVFIDTPQLHNENPLSKKFGDRRMLYGMDIKKLNGDHLARIAKGNQKSDTTNVHSDWKMLDAEYKEKYGLIFKPILRINENLRKIYTDENRSPPENMKPIMRINTLRCNLNTNSKNLTAVGYENGFLRLVSFNKGDYFKKK